MSSAVQFPSQPMVTFGGGGSAGSAVNRAEMDLFDCEVEGTLPPDLDGAFYRVGPDAQYPKQPQYAHDIGFDGEGHASMFRFKDGHVDFRSRWVRTQRWKAQHDARRSLFGMYRNPFTDDPSVKSLSRGTANTQVFFHHGKLMAFKEDSPPVVLDPKTLETLDDYYTFGGALKGETFTAHPKIDSDTGELIGFGYESKGLGSTDVEILSVDRHGKPTWHTWMTVPYAGMIHDVAVTATHIAFLVVPLAVDMEQIRAGGLHYSWDSTLPTWFGVLKRGADGKDVRWYSGPTTMCTHTMGAWSEGDKVFVDMDGGDGNQFPFFPNKHEPWDPVKAMGRIRRFSVDLADKTTNSFKMDVLYPEVVGFLSRQDDRYHTRPYRYGFLLGSSAMGGGIAWHMVDHKAGKVSTWSPGPDALVNEMCFVPRNKSAPEADGYLVGIVTRTAERGRSDLVLVDTRDLAAGPVATVKMPHKIVGQVHGFWVPGGGILMVAQVAYKRIATEEAFATKDQFEQFGKLLDSGFRDPGFESLWGFYLRSEAERPKLIRARLLDLDARRIADMDETGIDVQILSLTSPGVNMFEADVARAVSVSANDEMAAAIARHPTRFAGLAAFAPQDPAHAAKEIERGVKKLGLNGAIFNGHTRGEWLDDPKFWAIFEACEALDVPIYLHPTGPHPDLIKPMLERGLDGAIYGFAVDTGLHALRLIVAGLFDRFPKLKFVLGHLGEALPFWLFRLDFMHRAGVAAKRYKSMRPLKRTIGEYMRDNVYVTTSGMASEPSIKLCQEVLGMDHVLYAMDYPYEFVADEVTIQDNMAIGAGDKKKFFQTNAERLFKLA